jgi:hypothetical protein
MTSHNRLMVFLLVLASLICLGQTALWHVKVVNGLSGGKTLFLHCKSKDDDLGMHNLQVGSELSWHFKENYFSTLFWCNMRMDKGHANFHVFWANVNGEPEYIDYYFLVYRCKCFFTTKCTCTWTAKDDGIYLRNIPKNRDELMHKWEPGL